MTIKRELYGFEKKHIEKAKRLIAEYKKTWKNSDGSWTETHTCRTCHQEIPVKFSKKGKPFDSTKLYKVWVSQRNGFEWTHRGVGVCSAKCLLGVETNV